MKYQSPISPGISWYEDSIAERPQYPALDGDVSCDAAIIGGGFTGLSAAAALAAKGVGTILIDACRLGDGASGRNGGQLGTGQRAWAEETEAELGLERARALFNLAERAKEHLLTFARANEIDIDYCKGQMSVVHKRRYLDDYRKHADIMAERFSYPHISYMDAPETAERVGSTRYFGGVRDTGTGHIHPLKLVIGTARVAAASGARLYENTQALSIKRKSSKIVIATARGKISADRVLVATNAHGGSLEPGSASYIMPIGSFIGATKPLDRNSGVIAGGESVDDSRFVVRYFRRLGDGRLLFGGREIYSPGSAGDMEAGIRRQIADVYPKLKDVELTHAWGGYVGITMPRKPYVREVQPGVTVAGGFSGHGVMLSNYTGKLWADAMTGESAELELLKDMKIPAFPGGRRFRSPLLLLALSWYAFLDRV